jgi:hypothetical protein
MQRSEIRGSFRERAVHGYPGFRFTSSRLFGSAETDGQHHLKMFGLGCGRRLLAN